ncbi:MAG: bacteriohemerythrin [Anaerolineales bacterium]
MPLIHWKDDYSVNIKEIDAQHQNLVNMINGLHEAMREGRGNQVLQDLLKQLIDYTNYHFSTEEKLMQTYNYPGYVFHKKEHDDLTRKVLEFQQKFQQNPTGLGVQMMEFLKSWLVNHIQGTDKKYSHFFNNNGIR